MRAALVVSPAAISQSYPSGVGALTACWSVCYMSTLARKRDDDLEVGKIGLPHLVWRRGLVLELFRRLDDSVRWTRDQIVGLEQAID